MKNFFFLIPFVLYGCSEFKPGTKERMENIAIKDFIKIIEDEAIEAEKDIIAPPAGYMSSKPDGCKKWFPKKSVPKKKKTH